MDATQNINNEPKGAIESLKEHSLESAGYAYLLADAALIAAALIRKEPQVGVAVGSAIWGIGSLAAVGFGHKPAERHMHDLSNALRDDLEQKGITIPEGSNLSAASLAKKGGVIDGIQDFLYKNPSQTLNAIYGLGGVSMAYSAKDTAIRGSGSLVAAGGLLGILLAEKEEDKDKNKPKEAEQNTSFLSNPISWFTEKPLRISSAAYMANNVFLVKGAMDEVERVPKVGKYVAAASYVLANTMFALSSKDHSKQSGVPEEVLNSVEREAARVIATLPKEAQTEMMQHVAQHLSEQDGVNLTTAEIHTAMTSRLQEITTPHTHIANAATHGKSNIEHNIG